MSQRGPFVSKYLGLDVMSMKGQVRIDAPGGRNLCVAYKEEMPKPYVFDEETGWHVWWSEGHPVSMRLGHEKEALKQGIKYSLQFRPMKKAANRKKAEKKARA